MSRRHHRLLEPVLCSLTSGRRSFAGVTQHNVDRGVDYVLDSVFTQPFIRWAGRGPPAQHVLGKEWEARKAGHPS
jgi:hypothetical protein